MLSVFWNMKGIVYFELRKFSKTITSQIYAEQLKKVDEILRERGVNPRTIHLLAHNFRVHTSNLAQNTIEELGWKLVPHPPYSPDIAPSDYHLFLSMQHSLANQQFNNYQEVEIWVQDYFASQEPESFESGIRSLRKKWKNIVDNFGEYLLE